MKSNVTISRYNGISIALHWILAIALVAIFVVGLYMADLPFSPQRLKFYNWHKWAGISILFLSIVRLASDAPSSGPTPVN
jgi:cytochrome b561